MWYCEDCDIEITKNKKNRHLKTIKHQKNIGNNPYRNSNIYKIVCNDTKKIYIGSTIKTLSERLSEHKSDKTRYEQCKPNSSCVSSYQLLDNCYIELIEKYNCTTDEELKAREQYHIENNECVNYVRAKGISKREMDKEYRETHREKLKSYKSDYYIKHKEEYNKKGKDHYHKNKTDIRKRMNEKILCECGIMYSFGNRIRHRKSRRHLNSII